jgi:uncharacterized protein (UPF0276 family)
MGIDLVNDGPHINALLQRAYGLYDYVEVFDGGNTGLAREFTTAWDNTLPLLYHNPILNLCGDEIAPASIVSSSAACAELHGAPWCVEEMGYNRVAGYSVPYFLPAVLTRECAVRSARNLVALSSSFSQPITPEVPAYEVVFGDISLGEFVRTLVDESGIQFVLDLTHALSYAHAIGEDLLECCKALPLEHVNEVHLSGGAEARIGGVSVFRDTHGSERIPPVLFPCLEALLPMMPALRAVTVEVDGGSGPYAADDLDVVRRVVGV